MSICITIVLFRKQKKQNLRVKNNLTLRSHYSRYLQIFFARNIITSIKCSKKITVLLIQPNPTHHVLENATQPNPTYPWMDPTHVHLCYVH